ncbi:LuxR C-terminal-related transcriptional regulator [Actinoplanes sp. NPDC026670]|uniref:LuxR C-terminal-related transcriptional regulator n=1 Tax=Actinoplanes sp. NPDC026670 TaxID=3154700 RepID=UPI0033D7E517
MTVVVGVDGSGRTHRLRMLAAAATGPVVWFTAPPVSDGHLILVDDAHRLDPSALKILAAAARAGAPMAVARRPTITGPELADLDEAAAADGVELLAPLDADGVARLVATVTGRPVSPEVAAAVFEASAGLPALVVALAGAGAGVPAALVARVQRRFAVLDPAAASAARILALRLDLTDHLIATACGIEAPDLARIIRTLRDEGLLAPAPAATRGRDPDPGVPAPPDPGVRARPGSGVPAPPGSGVPARPGSGVPAPPGGERMIPAVAEAIMAELPGAERRRIHDAVAGAMITAGTDPVAAAGQLRAARAMTPTAAAVYREAAERLRFTDPTIALGWYEDAADAGADPSSLAPGRAEAGLLLGLPVDLDDLTPAESFPPAAAGRLSLVAGAVAAHDGRAARAAELLLAAPAPGPALAVPFLIGIGQPHLSPQIWPGPSRDLVEFRHTVLAELHKIETPAAVLDADGALEDASANPPIGEGVWEGPAIGEGVSEGPAIAEGVSAGPAVAGGSAVGGERAVAAGQSAGRGRGRERERERVPVAFALFAEGVAAAGKPEVALPLIIEAAEAVERSSAQVVLPDTPHAIGAVVAVAAGDVGSAEHLLDRARTADVGGPVAEVRHRLLLAWARMRAGRHETALEELRRPGGEMSGRDRLLRAAIAAGIARRRGDIAGLRDAWAGVEPLLARRAVDLWQLEAVEELAVAAARLRRLHRVTPILELLDQAVAGLGRPPAWQIALDWIHLQTAVAADDPTAAAEAAARLADAATSAGLPLGGRSSAMTGGEETVMGEAAAAGGEEMVMGEAAAAGGAAPVRAGGGAVRPRALAVAGQRWAEVLGGVVDIEAVIAATEDLQAAELPWEASRLAGQAAIRTADGVAARRLLERARELSEPEPEGPGGGGLSEREVTVARLVLAGSTHREIGAQLYISPKTVEHHVARIRAKVGANTRAELLAVLRELLEA